MNFDPKKFIDREFEKELFEELLTFTSPARVLTIRDSGGTGKSHLLGRFQYHCRTLKPRIPVSFIRAEQLTDASPLFVVQTIAEELSSTFKLKFPNYNRLEGARVSADFSFIRSSVYLNEANFSGAKNVRIGSTIIETAQQFSVVAGSTKPLTAEEQRVAQGAVIDAFFQDLLEICDTQPVVVMFDTYDKANKGLRKWIENYLLENYFFNVAQPVLLAIVIAGQEVPYCLGRWSEDLCQAVVKPIDGLRMWRKAHVEEWLRVHGFKYEVEDLNAFYRLIEIGMPPSEVVNMMQTLLRGR